MLINSNRYGGKDFVRVVENIFQSSFRECFRIDNIRRLQLEGNVFSSTGQTAVYIYQTSPEIILIQNNTFQQSPRALFISLRNAGQNDALMIVKNYFFDHSDGPVVKLDFASYKVTAEIYGNNFTNNKGHDASMLYIKNNDATSAENVAVLDNLFDNPSAAYDLRVDIPYSEGHVTYAMRNWWGGEFLSHVRSRIYDFGTDSKVAKVAFEPYRVSRETTTLSDTTSGFFLDDTTIGGTVTEDTTLKKTDRPYLVVDDIFIPSALTLTVEAGVVLMFQRSGITVEGNHISPL